MEVVSGMGRGREEEERSAGFSRLRWRITFISFISILQAAHVFEGIFF
jgi:hypothetical protein